MHSPSFISRHATHRSHIASAGFTLLEVMVAVFVLSVGILSIINVLSQVSDIANNTRDKVIAANLAQEGAEIVHNIRTSNWIAGDAYGLGLTSIAGGCVDYNDTEVTDACDSLDRALYQDSDGVYSHDNTGNQTKFERTIIIDSSSTDSDGYFYLKVESVVSWDGNSITVESRLYDWL